MLRIWNRPTKSLIIDESVSLFSFSPFVSCPACRYADYHSSTPVVVLYRCLIYFICVCWTGGTDRDYPIPRFSGTLWLNSNSHVSTRNLQRIFSFLASEARVLVACSQAHSTFAQLVEPILYAHVIVYDDDVDTEDGHHLKLKPYQLSALLTDNPRILNHLRSLSLSVQLYSYDEVLKEIVTILPRLKLEYIQLSFIKWEWLPMAFRTAFVACISTSYMKEIRIDNVHCIPLCSFGDCAGLKHLTLGHHANPRAPSNSPFNLPQLESLELFDWGIRGASDYFFSWALTHVSGLHSLTLRTSERMGICTFLPRFLTMFDVPGQFKHLLHQNPVSPLTQSLKLCSCYRTVPLINAKTIDFPDLPSLERLCLCTYTSSSTCPVRSDEYLVHYALTTIAIILRNLSSLKHLTLIVCLQFRGNNIAEVDWSPLADFLSERLSSFQHTDLFIHAVTTGGEVSSDEVNSMLSRCENLMSLVEAGHISVKEGKYLDMDVNRYCSEYFGSSRIGWFCTITKSIWMWYPIIECFPFCLSRFTRKEWIGLNNATLLRGQVQRIGSSLPFHISWLAQIRRTLV